MRVCFRYVIMTRAFCILLVTCFASCAPFTSEAVDSAAGTLEVASLMYRPAKWDKDANKEGLEKAIREARGMGAELIVTPEGALEGYMVNEVIRAEGEVRAELTKRFNALAEPADGPYIRHFRGLCRELRVYLVLGFLEADGGGTYNSAVLIDPNGAVAGKYRKTHFAQGYSTGENKGDNPVGYWRGTDYPVFDVADWKMGIMICFDRRVPEVAGQLAENGARFIVNPSYGMKGDCNREFISARAADNGLPILFVHPEQTVLSDRYGQIVRDIRPEADEARIAIIQIESTWP